jgi:hypothetical protein
MGTSLGLAFNLKYDPHPTLGLRGTVREPTRKTYLSRLLTQLNIPYKQLENAAYFGLSNTLLTGASSSSPPHSPSRMIR